MIDITIPIELKNSNDGRGKAFWASMNTRREYESQIRSLGLVRQPLRHQVDLRVIRILGKGQRKWDADSVLRGSAKELIDALVACGWFEDDGPKWVRLCIGEQDDTRREHGPAVRIVASEVD